MPSDSEFQRRFPAVEREISQIKPADIRVRLIGTIVDKQGERAVLDDGSGKIDIAFTEPTDIAPGQLVRVFGRVISLESGFELQGELIQPLKDFDLELWKKVRNLEERLKDKGEKK